jgi:transcriptional regulator with XRE-family HTH domain/quercetin dioxygenase-like cupin family protein
MASTTGGRETTSLDADVGARIRAQREDRGLTVRGLAREIGTSASLVSQIETGKARPSVRTLYAITTALGVSVEDLLTGTDGGGRRGNSDDAAVASGGTGLAPLVSAGPRDRRVGPVVRAGEREVVSLEAGVTWELLGQVPGTHVDFLQVTYAPGASSSATGELMRHLGVEHGYVVSGELILTLGFDDHLLRPGDAVSFESAAPHRYRNDGEVPAVGIWFVTA